MYEALMSNVIKNFDSLAINLSVLHNYFDSSIKSFSDLCIYLAKYTAKFPSHKKARTDSDYRSAYIVLLYNRNSNYRIRQ